MDGKAECPVCGGNELLRASGGMRAHFQMRVRPGVAPGTVVEYRSEIPCGGAGELPEPAELVSAGGA